MDLEDIKIREINVFLDLLRTHSVRELARQRNIQPGQVSKILNSLENKVGFKLVERSPFGIKITTKAREILPLFNEIRSKQEAFQSSFVKNQEKPILGFATTSFFSTQFLPGLFSNFTKRHPELKLRLLDLPPDLFLSVALRNGFQICLHLREMDWPKTWTSVKVGELSWILCCRKNHACLDHVTMKNVVKFPFVYPVYWSNDGISYGDDNFPVTLDKRIRGYETTTATSAVEIIRRTDHLGFVPEIVARPLIESGQLIKLEIASLRNVTQPVYLTVKSDRISQSMFKWLSELCTTNLKKGTP